MNNHLTDRQLLDAQFKLCAATQAEAVAAHLAECADCRGRADALKQKFASLDLLRGDVSASEQLIAETLRQVRNEPKPHPAFLPRLGWLGGLAAAAAVLVALLYVGPVTTRRTTQVAMTVKVPAPAVEVAMRQEVYEEMRAKEVPAERNEVADYAVLTDKDQIAPAAEARGAGAELARERADYDAEGEIATPEPKSSSGGGFAVGRSAVAMKAARGFSFAAPPPAAPQPVQSEWSVSAPADVTVSVNPALVEFDDALQKLKKGDGKMAQQYSVQVVNSSKNPATALVTRSFSTTNWLVRVGDDMVRVSTQDAQNVELSIEAPAQSTKSFHCTVIVPAEPAKGVVP